MTERTALLGGTTRREFLAAFAGAAAAVAALPAVRAADREERKRPWPLRLSTSTVHFAKLPLDEACRRIARAGYAAVDIWASFGECHHLDRALAATPAEELKALLEKEKLRLNAFSVYTEGYPKYAEYLGKVGGGVAVTGSAGPAKPEELAARMKDFLEKLKPQVELAEKNGSRLAIENHGASLLDTLDSFKAFTDLNRSPRLGIALAPYHLQAGKMPVEEAIRICGKQLFFFYAWQNAPDARQLPGAGTTDFGPWLDALAGIGYPGWLNAFMHGELEPDAMEAALAKSREYLADCHAKVAERRR